MAPGPTAANLGPNVTSRQGIPCHSVSSEHFYTERGEAAALFAGRKQWLMEHFTARCG